MCIFAFVFESFCKSFHHPRLYIEIGKGMVPQKTKRGLLLGIGRKIQSRQNDRILFCHLKVYASPQIITTCTLFTTIAMKYITSPPIPNISISLELLVSRTCHTYLYLSTWHFLYGGILATFLFIFQGISFNYQLLCSKPL